MRQAMAQADVGDDVYGEDPTVNRLEAMAAEMLGKEAALFVPSGTMGNLISVLAHCGRGDEVILGDRAHILLNEQGGIAQLGGVHPRTVRNLSDGTLDMDEIRASIRGDDEHYPISRLIALENTHNRCGGRVLSIGYVDAVAAVAHEQGLGLHVDGARIWNASVALGETPARLLQGADSVSACLSKGLAAPVGSVVAGDQDYIRRARRVRKVVGGGMRQAGVIAAAGIVALTAMVDRLSEDHANAKVLARGLQGIDGIEIVPDHVETNIVIFGLTREDMTPRQLADAMATRGVLLHPVGPHALRAVTNCHVSAHDVELALAAFEEVLA
jgi:threonine aldolase